jgi:putative sterol carrier protein
MPRVNSAEEVFALMPEHFLPEQAGNLNAVLQFDLSGDGGGQWVAAIAGGQLTVTKGTVPSPNLTLNMAAKDYVAMVNGELNPMTAFMQGKVKAKGDTPLLMKMQKMFSFS